jgi:hypothetical protein
LLERRFVEAGQEDQGVNVQEATLRVPYIGGHHVQASEIHIHPQGRKQEQQSRDSFQRIHGPIEHTDDEYGQGEIQAPLAVSLNEVH